MHSAPWANIHAVSIFRILMCLYLWALSIWLLVESPLKSFVYFTKWGIFLTTITYTFLAAFHIQQYFFRKSKDSLLRNYQSFYSPWLLWKWGIVFYESAFTFEVVIVLFFWIVLYPLMDHSDPGDLRDNILMHASPMAILVADYVINRIPFSFKHLPVSIFIMLMYGVVNLSYTLSSGTPVYPPLNFKDVMSYVWIVVLAFIESITYAIMFFITRFKLKKYRQMDLDYHSELTVFEVAGDYKESMVKSFHEKDHQSKLIDFPENDN
eukprot:403364223